jgi:hypothetical protein
MNSTICGFLGIEPILSGDMLGLDACRMSLLNDSCAVAVWGIWMGAWMVFCVAECIEPTKDIDNPLALNLISLIIISFGAIFGILWINIPLALAAFPILYPFIAYSSAQSEKPISIQHHTTPHDPAAIPLINPPPPYP